eukprot:448786_1
MNVSYKEPSINIHNSHHHHHIPTTSPNKPIKVHYYLYRSNVLPLPLPPNNISNTNYINTLKDITPTTNNTITSITTVPRLSSITSIDNSGINNMNITINENINVSCIMCIRIIIGYISVM